MYLIVYDISSDRIRSKVAKRLVAEGYERIQLSVFCGIPNPEQLSGLWEDLCKWLESDVNGQLLSINIGPDNFRNLDAIGLVFIDFEYLLGEQTSLFI